jgi:hypothetical protein
MDCGVQVDAGKPTIIAEDYLKTLTNQLSKPSLNRQKYHRTTVALACKQMAAAVATFNDSSPPG